MYDGRTSAASLLLLATILGALAFVALALVATSPFSFLAWWLGLLIWQNSAIGLITPTVVSGPALAIVEAKTLTMSVAAVYLLCTLTRHERQVFAPLLVPFVLFVLLAFIRARGADAGTLAYARNFLIGPAVILVVAVASFRASSREAVGWLRQAALWTTVILLIGALLELALGTVGWRHALNFDRLPYMGGVSSYTSLFGHRAPRIGSFMIEPVNLAFIGAAAALVSLLHPLMRNPLVIGMGVALIVLATGKGAAQLMIVAVAIAGFRPTRRLLLQRPMIGVLAAVVLSIALAMIYAALVLGPSVLLLVTNPLAIVGRGESFTYHLAGLSLAVQNLPGDLFGSGLGAGGNLAAQESGSGGTAALLRAGGESGVGVLIYQLGAPGLLAFSFLVARIARAGGYGKLAGMCPTLLAVWVCALLFQEQPLGPQASGMLWLGIGIALGQSLQAASQDAIRSRGSSVAHDARGLDASPAASIYPGSHHGRLFRT
jgi:hypothetical protein